MIPYGKQNVSDQDIEEVISVLRSDFLTQGPKVPAFEQAVAKYCGAKFGVASSSATSALHLACLALKIGPGDIVWTSAITFVASANCAVYCGASVDFLEIDSRTYNICIDALEEKLLEAERVGRLPKLIIAVHMCGQSCEMKRIHALSEKYGFFTVEDASHAIGARYQNIPVGSCSYSDITVFSFHPVKIITTGEGGMALTNDQSLSAKMQRLRSHGITRDPDEMLGASEGPWFYQQLELGFNYRMTDIQAALGMSQLARLDQFVYERQRLAAAYDQLLAEREALGPWIHPDCLSSYHLYAVQLDFNLIKATQREVFERFRSNGIMVNLHYIPVYRHPFYRSLSRSMICLKNAEIYYSRALTLPLFPGLSEETQKDIIIKLFTPLGHQTIF